MHTLNNFVHWPLAKSLCWLKTYSYLTPQLSKFNWFPSLPNPYPSSSFPPFLTQLLYRLDTCGEFPPPFLLPTLFPHPTPEATQPLPKGQGPVKGAPKPPLCRTSPSPPPPSQYPDLNPISLSLWYASRGTETSILIFLGACQSLQTINLSVRPNVCSYVRMYLCRICLLARWEPFIATRSTCSDIEWRRFKNRKFREMRTHVAIVRDQKQWAKES